MQPCELIWRTVHAALYAKVIFENIGTHEVSKAESALTSIFAQMGRYCQHGEICIREIQRIILYTWILSIHIYILIFRLYEISTETHETTVEKLQEYFNKIK